MIDRVGNLFDTDAKILGHGVNVDGLMGAGIAKTFADKFPENLKGYKQRCADKSLVPGGVYLSAREKVVVANFASQSRPGAFAQYDWLFSSLYNGVRGLSSHTGIREQFGSVIAIPEIGCGIGGLEYKKVVPIILAVEKIFPDFEFEVWHYKP